MAVIINGLAIQEAVTRDGLPRLAVDGDGKQYVMYRAPGAHIAQSMPVEEWAGPLPTDPTEAEIAAALAVRDAERATRADLAQRLQTAARAHAGKRADQLTLPELRDLFALWLLAQGMLDGEGKVG
jgi:hypothetical protein